jgi:hypothetical protein
MTSASFHLNSDLVTQFSEHACDIQALVVVVESAMRCHNAGQIIPSDFLSEIRTLALISRRLDDLIDEINNLSESMHKGCL